MLLDSAASQVSQNCSILLWNNYSNDQTTLQSAGNRQKTVAPKTAVVCFSNCTPKPCKRLSKQSWNQGFIHLSAQVAKQNFKETCQYAVLLLLVWILFWIITFFFPMPSDFVIRRYYSYVLRGLVKWRFEWSVMGHWQSHLQKQCTFIERTLPGCETRSKVI